MASFFSSLFQWFSGLFFSKQAEISVVGLQASGKTSFVNVIWSEEVVPTVAFNFRKVRRGNITLKIWDVAGQPRYRSIWERYCNGVDAIMCKEKFDTARFELHQLLSQPTREQERLDGHAPVNELIKALQLDKIQNRPVSVLHRDIVLQWLAGRSH
ncbi:P-loop containing nucleoside triphosphate hydrolase protein [Fomitopsis betulina]|nr:P-loop containing nucleoside triphosphate hydrolase protein [Fomitopsis betulina]